MNAFHFSGWLPVAPERRMTGDLRTVIIFRLNVLSAAGEEQQLFFRLDDEAIVARCGDALTVGRSVFGTAEARRVPVVKSGIHVTDHITFYVRELEVPNRSKDQETKGLKDQGTEDESPESSVQSREQRAKDFPPTPSTHAAATAGAMAG